MSKVRRILCFSDSAASVSEQPSSSDSENEMDQRTHSKYIDDDLAECCQTRPRIEDRTITRAPAAYGTYVAPSRQGTYSRQPTSLEESRDYTNLGPWRHIEVPEHLQQKNIPPGAHKSFPQVQRRASPRQVSAYQDTKHMLDLKEVLEHRKKAPRYYSTPVSDSFHGGAGIDESTIWGQHLSSYDPTKSSGGWSQGVRMASFNVIKHMTPSPKDVRGPPRQMRSYPPPPSPRYINPTLSQYSKVVFPDSTRSDASESDNRAPNVTFTPPPVGWMPQIAHDRPINVPFTENVRRTNLPTDAHKTYPMMQVPPPSRNYFTYDSQPVLNSREVAEQRKRPPIDLNLPVSGSYIDEQYDVNKFSAQQPPIGWSNAVRMETNRKAPSKKASPALQQSYTAQPRDARGGGVDSTFSCPGALCADIANTPASCIPYADAYADVLPCEAANNRYGSKPTPYQGQSGPGTARRPLDATKTRGTPQPARSQEQNATFSAGQPCVDDTCPIRAEPKRDANRTFICPSQPDPARNQDECFAFDCPSQPGMAGEVAIWETPKRSKKKFTTVLEVRTPTCCDDEPSQPVQLSINVTCADPSVLMTPDKRFNIISNTSPPEAMFCVSPDSKDSPPCNECSTQPPPEEENCCPCGQKR